MEQLAAGHPLKSTQYAAGAFLRPITAAIKGNKVLNEWRGENLKAANAAKRLTGLDAEAQKALEAANAIPTGHHIDYHQTQSVWTDVKRRGVVNAIKNEASTAMHSAIEAWQKNNGFGKIVGEARALSRGLIRALDTVVPISQLMFDHYIPMVKAGLAHEQMKAWIKDNPNSSQLARAQVAAKIGRGLDNIIGEADPDNLFINRALLEASRLILLSPSFNLGSIRNLGDAVKQLPSAVTKHSTSPRSGAYNPSLPLLIGQATAIIAIGTVSNLLMTGKMPESALDYFAPKTGGKNERGEDIRLKMPGEVNFVLDLMHAAGFPGGGAAGFYPESIGLGPLKSKLNPLISNTLDLSNNEDYAHKPIVTARTPMEAAWQAFAHVIDVKPFALGDTSPWRQPDAAKIPLAAKVLDIPIAGKAYRNPEGYKAMIEREKHKQAPKAWGVQRNHHSGAH